MDSKRFVLLQTRAKQSGSKMQHIHTPIPLFDEEIDDVIIAEISDAVKKVHTQSLTFAMNCILTLNLQTPPYPAPMSRQPSTLSVLSGPTALSEPAIEEIPFLQRIRAHQLLRRTHQPIPKRHSDYIREERLPNRPQRGLFFLDWFRPRRPLRPYREDRRDSLATSMPEGCKILVHVLRGLSVPIRKHRNRNARELYDESDGPAVSPTQAY